MGGVDSLGVADVVVKLLEKGIDDVLLMPRSSKIRLVLS